MADGENGDESVELVRDGECEARPGCRQRIARETREILLGDCVGDRFGFAVIQGVIPAHDPLQFREFPHHGSQKVAFREFRGTLGRGRILARDLRDLRGEGGHAHRLVGKGAELRLESDACERFAPRGEGRFPVGGIKERGIREPGPDHALIASADLRRIPAFDIGDRDEARQQVPVLRPYREITLVVLHRRDEHLRRKLEEARFEMARHRHRPLGQRRHFVEKRLVDDRDAALGFGRGDGARANAFAACLEIGEHMAAAFEHREITAGRTECDRLRRMKPMAARHPTGREAEDFSGDNVVAVQQDDPMNRADELHRARAPTHAPRDRKLIERGLHDPRQELSGANSGPRQLAEQEFSLGVVDAREFVDGDTAGFGEGLGRARRLSRGVERNGDRRAAPLDTLLGLAIEELLHQHSEAARREVGERSAVREPGGIEARDDGVAKRLGERNEAFRRQFLDADLDKKVVARHIVKREQSPLPCGQR